MIPPAPADALLLRSALMDRIRAFFTSRGFLEVDTPLLYDAVPAEASSEPFEVSLRHGRERQRRFLPASPELGLKRLVPVLDRDLFEIGHAFRNAEDEGRQHRAHFRLLEWYRLRRDWRSVLDDAEAMMDDFAAFFAERDVPAPIPARGMERLTVAEAFERHLGVRVGGPDDLAGLVEVARDRGHGDCADWQEAFHILMGVHVQPQLGLERPTALTHYPAGIAVQARPCPDEPWLAEQFELYVRGVELMNCYTELTDPALLRSRFGVEERAARARGFDLSWDEALVRDLTALPAPTAGGCLGVDRLLMLWLAAESIDAVRP